MWRSDAVEWTKVYEFETDCIHYVSSNKSFGFYSRSEFLFEEIQYWYIVRFPFVFRTNKTASVQITPLYLWKRFSMESPGITLVAFFSHPDSTPAKFSVVVAGYFQSKGYQMALTTACFFLLPWWQRSDVNSIKIHSIDKSPGSKAYGLTCRSRTITKQSESIVFLNVQITLAANSIVSQTNNRPPSWNLGK